ncbi:MAG: DNA internalization-related competence protein ComEC/Rec2 [Clostridiales bacterium]|nr:DNA internalization-related competence protein ComEC/Rec2 [Clostridiales bacterium]
MRRPLTAICVIALILSFTFTKLDDSHSFYYYKAGYVNEITGVVLSSEEKEENKFSLEVMTPEGEKILLSLTGNIENVRGESIEKYYDLTGKDVRFRSIVSIPQGRRNPGCFDYNLYLRSRGIEVITELKCSQLEVTGVSENLYHRYLSYVALYKGYFTELLEELSDSKTISFISAMMFGDKASFDDEIYEEFRQNGTAHVLAVSGLHVGAVYEFMSRFIKPDRKKSALLINGAILAFYAALSSFSPSVVRAVIMILIHMSAEAVNRRYDMISAACFCMIVNVIINPYCIYNSGFQLSYLAVFSIAVIGSAIREYLDNSFTAMVSVQIGMFPLTAYTFNYFSLGAFIANIPIIYLTGLLVPFGVVLMVMLPVFDCLNVVTSIQETVLLIPEILVKIIILINEVTYADGLFTFDVVSPGISTMILYYGFVFGVCSETFVIWSSRKMYKRIIFAICIIVIVALFSGITFDDRVKDDGLVFVDVGQGDCLHIRTETGNYLIDGGGSVSYDTGMKTLKPYLLKNGVRYIDIAFVTHLHTDHYDGIVSLCREGMVRKLCLYEGNIINEDSILKETGLKKEDIIYVKAGDIAELGDNVYAEVLSPVRMTRAEYHILEREDDENQSSLIIKLHYDDMSVLMTGDIDSEAEKKLISKYGKNLDCTILKAAHHGSKYSTCDEFLEAASPEVIVFQVGENNYGHPDKTLIENCLQKGIMVYRNDLNGAVIIDGKGSIRTCF